jgi:hypothetical protein
VEIAQRIGDTDVVLDAMSQRGMRLVADGQAEAGMALLDEALAAVAAGEVRDLVAAGAMYCKMLHACELTCDVRRAEDWLALADRFVEQTNRIPISAICRTHYGAVLTAAGRWTDAERELATASQLYDRSYRRYAVRPSSGWPGSGSGRAGSPRPRSCSTAPRATRRRSARSSSCTSPAASPSSR